jgi:hypothetical protein
MPTPAADSEQIAIKFHGFSTSYLHRSRLIPRESDILKAENYNKRSVYLLPKSSGQPLGESWPRAIRSGRGRVGM